MSAIEDPAMAFLLEQLMPLHEQGGPACGIPGPDPAMESYFLDCATVLGGQVREMSEDVGDMLRELAARWRADGRDDLAGLEEPLLALARALQEAVDESAVPELKTAGDPLF